MRRSLIVAASAAFAGSALAVLASPAEAVTNPVDIRVEHDLDEGSDGPRVLEVQDVSAGDGPEITIADETENPSGWGGNVLVDIDPGARTITVEVEDENCYDSVIVEITTDEVGAVSLVSDALYDDPSELTLDTSVAGGVVTLAWNSNEGEDCPSLADVGSQAVFSYTLAGAAEPDASLAPERVQSGDPVTVEGTGCTNSPVEVLVTPQGEGEPVIEDEVIGDAEGDWSYEIDTSDLDVGAYDVATRCILADGQGFSYEVLGFSVSFEPAPATPAPVAPTFTG